MTRLRCPGLAACTPLPKACPLLALSSTLKPYSCLYPLYPAACVSSALFRFSLLSRDGPPFGPFLAILSALQFSIAPKLTRGRLLAPREAGSHQAGWAGQAVVCRLHHAGMARHRWRARHRCLWQKGRATVIQRRGQSAVDIQGRLPLELKQPASLHLQRLGCHGHRPLQRVVTADEARGVHKHAARDATSGAAGQVGPHLQLACIVQ